MNKFQIVIVIFLAFFFSCQPSSQKEISEKENYSLQIDSAKVLVNLLMETNKTPGMAVSVAVDGEMVWSEGFGYADIENEIEVDPSRTMFRIGSVSKTLTASAIGKLIDAEKIDTEEIVQTYVPDFPKKKYPITVKQAAGHIAGIRHYKGNEFLSDRYYETVREGLDIFKNDTLLFKPGTAYSYSSYGWNLISAVIEGASGQDFLTFMKGEIFDPLDMTSTLPDMATKEIPNRTKFYVVDNGSVDPAPYVDNSYKWAGGGFIATSEDLIKFGKAHMSAGFLSEASLNELQSTQRLESGEETNYGMGWGSGKDENGFYYVRHSGGSVGGITQFVIFPEQGVIVAMVSNSSPLNYDGTHLRIASLFQLAKGLSK